MKVFEQSKFQYKASLIDQPETWTSVFGVSVFSDSLNPTQPKQISQYGEMSADTDLELDKEIEIITWNCVRSFDLGLLIEYNQYLRKKVEQKPSPWMWVCLFHVNCKGL